MLDIKIAEWNIGHRKQKVQEGKREQERGRICLFHVPESCRLCCVLTGIYSIPYSPSAAGWNNTAGTVPDTNPRSNNSPEDTDHLPPLEELFGELQGDDYIERLEELAESLLREVTAEVEANSHRTNEQVSILIITNLLGNYIMKYFNFITLYYRNEWIVWKIKFEFWYCTVEFSFEIVEILAIVLKSRST